MAEIRGFSGRWGIALVRYWVFHHNTKTSPQHNGSHKRLSNPLNRIRVILHIVKVVFRADLPEALKIPHHGQVPQGNARLEKIFFSYGSLGVFGLKRDGVKYH